MDLFLLSTTEDREHYSFIVSKNFDVDVRVSFRLTVGGLCQVINKEDDAGLVKQIYSHTQPLYFHFFSLLLHFLFVAFLFTSVHILI